MADTSKLYRKIADLITASIEQGEHKRGGRLPPERELAERYGVSRPTVREAMIALEMRGLVEPRHGSGIYVTARPQLAGEPPETEVGAFELIEARRLFEGESAALAAATIDEEQIAELERLLVLMNDEEEIRGEEADREFHLTIARATGNGAIAETVEQLWEMRNRSPLARNILARARGSGLQPRIAEHRRIVEALRSRNPDDARRAMHHHLERVIQHLLRATSAEAVPGRRSEADEAAAPVEPVAVSSLSGQSTEWSGQT